MTNHHVTTRTLIKSASGLSASGNIDVKATSIGSFELITNGRYLATIGDHTAEADSPVTAARLAFARHVKDRSDVGFAR